MKTIPYTEEAYQLLHEGTLALARIEAAGIRIDVTYLEKAIKDTAQEVTDKQEALKRSEVMKVWRDRYRSRFSFNSGQQLGKVLFESMKIPYPVKDKTQGGSYRTDEDTLSKVDHPFVRDYFDIKKSQKGGQFLDQIKRELCGRFIHPSFGLNVPRSFRSQCAEPNVQQLPVRNEKLSHTVRRCIRARKGRKLVEVDLKQAEVFTGYFYHLDPKMKSYLTDKRNDMHRDAAIDCFLLPKDTPPEWWKGKMGKIVRYTGKNAFVFPQFYGAWWIDCAAGLWEAMIVRNLEAPDGTLIKRWLRQKGIKELGDQDKENPSPREGTFEAHICAVTKKFWGQRFKVYDSWKKSWYSTYQEKGWFQGLSGFIFQGHMSRNDATNYPVQSASFHCFLWALNEIILREIPRRGMNAVVINEIHDSLLGDVPEDEVDDFIAMCREIIEVKLKEHWDWILLPFEVEVEVTPVGGSWIDKEEVKLG